MFGCWFLCLRGPKGSITVVGSMWYISHFNNNNNQRVEKNKCNFNVMKFQLVKIQYHNHHNVTGEYPESGVGT